MTLVTEQQETMFAESEEAQASLHEELKQNHGGEAEDSTGFAPQQFSGEPDTAVEPGEPVAVEAASAEALHPASTPEAGPLVADQTSAEPVTAESEIASTPAHTEQLPILTAADFSALEERVLRAVSLVRREREGRIAAEERVAVLEGRIVGLEQASGESARLREEVEALRAEREQVRQRVERLLGQLDSLEF